MPHPTHVFYFKRYSKHKNNIITLHGDALARNTTERALGNVAQISNIAKRGLNVYEYSSPVPRAQQTARIGREMISGVKIPNSEKSLSEIATHIGGIKAYKAMDSMSKGPKSSEIVASGDKKKIEQLIKDWWDKRDIDLESHADVLKRFNQVKQKI